MADLFDIIGNIIAEGFSKVLETNSKPFRISFIVLFLLFDLGIIFICIYLGIILLKDKIIISLILLGIAFLFLLLLIYFIIRIKSKKPLN